MRREAVVHVDKLVKRQVAVLRRRLVDDRREDLAQPPLERIVLKLGLRHDGRPRHAPARLLRRHRIICGRCRLDVVQHTEPHLRARALDGLFCVGVLSAHAAEVGELVPELDDVGAREAGARLVHLEVLACERMARAHDEMSGCVGERLVAARPIRALQDLKRSSPSRLRPTDRAPRARR